MVERDGVGVDREAALLLELVGHAQVDDGAQPVRAQHLDVVGREAVEAVGAEQRVPAHRAPVAGGVAAEVAEVEHAGEGDAAFERDGRQVRDDRVHGLDGRRGGWRDGHRAVSGTVNARRPDAAPLRRGSTFRSRWT